MLNKYECGKVGFALDISDFDQMYQANYFCGLNIYDWEKRFWSNRIEPKTENEKSKDLDKNSHYLYSVPVEIKYRTKKQKDR